MPSLDLDATPTGWMRAMGLRFVSASAARVEMELEVAEVHLQPFGVVHGGVHAGLVETVGSIGAWLSAPEGYQVVGIENHTSFLRPVTSGTLRVVGVPLQQGRRAQLWEANVYDTDDRLVATGRLRVMCVPQLG